MEEQAAAAMLAQDISEHFTALQVGGFVVMLVLALVGVVLAMRAYAILGEAQALYWKTASMISAAAPSDAARRARADAIRTRQPSRRINTGRARHVM